jgi:hypothetical protein
MKTLIQATLVVVLGLLLAWWMNREDSQISKTTMVGSKDFASEEENEDDLQIEEITDIPEAEITVTTSTVPNSRLEKKLLELDPQAQPKILRNEAGEVTTLRGFKIKSNNLLETAMQLATALGFDSSQLQESPNKLDGTPDSQASIFDQAYQGYQVYAGYIKTISKKPEGSIYFVANELKNVGDPDLRIDFDVFEAEQIALQKYPGKRNPRLGARPTKPLIFVLRPQVSELVWKLEISWDGPLVDRRQLMISAKSGLVLDDISMISQ